MAKIPKCVSLDEDVYNDISEKSKKYGFEFSSWVNREYRNQFMSIEAKREQIKKHQQEIKKLKEEIIRIVEFNKAIEQSLGRDEIRFFRNVPRLLKEGKKLINLFRRYNVSFNRDISIYKFRELVHYFERNK